MTSTVSEAPAELSDAEFIRHLVDSAPPLSAAQRDLLAGLLSERAS